MTTPTHWCPVPDFEYKRGSTEVIVATFDHLPHLVSLHCESPHWFYGEVQLRRPVIEQLRDHLTELLKHMPEDNQ